MFKNHGKTEALILRVPKPFLWWCNTLQPKECPSYGTKKIWRMLSVHLLPLLFEPLLSRTVVPDKIPSMGQV